MPSDNFVVLLKQALLEDVLATAPPGNDIECSPSAVDVPTLVARLDAERPYSEARDALLSDLLRLHRQRPDGATLSVLLHALVAGVMRRCRRVASEGRGPRDGAAEIYLALVAHLGSFDPDRRSTHVQASVERAVHDQILRGRVSERRSRAKLAAIARSARADLDAGFHGLADLIETHETPDNDTTPEHDAEDEAAVGALEARLATSRLLRPREAALLCRVDVRGQPVADAASAIGMSHTAAKQALWRARLRLRAQGEKLRSLLLLPSRPEGASTE